MNALILPPIVGRGMTDLAAAETGNMLREWKSMVVGKDWLLTRKGAA